MAFDFLKPEQVTGVPVVVPKRPDIGFSLKLVPMTMIHFSRLLAASLLTTVCLGAGAAPTPPAVRAEIDALMSKLSTSNCQFERNGSWHDAADARAHLARKLAYIEKRRETLASAEQFIEFAASKSSFSGKPYRVKCGAAEPLPSSAWLTRELKALRASGQRAKP